MRVEIEKMQQARILGIESGLFSVPEIVSFDEVSGTLTMHRIPRIRGIRQFRLSSSKQYELIDRLGKAISLVHEQLRLPDEMRIPLPQGLDHPGEGVFLHGDLSTENVCLTDDPHPKIVLIDWQMSPRYGGRATWGTRYFDIAWFIGNLFRRPIWKYVYGPDANMSAAIFVNSYMRNAGLSDYAADFREYHEKFFLQRMNTQERNLPWLKHALLAPGFHFWRDFIKSH